MTINYPQKLEPLQKVVILVGLINGVMPSWAEEKGDLSKLVCALTDMDESEAEKAIKEAVHHDLIKYYGPQD